MKFRSAAIVLGVAFSLLHTDAARAQVSGVSVAPPSPVVNQPATVTVSGQGPCSTLLIDFGDGNDAQLFDPSVLPFTTPFTWTTAGSKTITAAGHGNCSGQGSVTIQVNNPIGTSNIARLCATVACGERPKMVFTPTITALIGFNTPGGYVAIAGKHFGAQLGAAVATLRNWKGETLHRRLEAVEWTNTMVGVQWPTDVTGVRYQTATLVVTTVDGVPSPPRSFTFSPALDLKRLALADVRVVSCSYDGNANACNFGPPDIHPSFVYIPPELAANAAIVGVHMNRWAAVGNDSGTDVYQIALKRGWTLESFEWRVSAEPGQAMARKPAGFTKGAAWSPSVDWEVTPNDQVVYAAVLTITGPVGVPHK